MNDHYHLLQNETEIRALYYFIAYLLGYIHDDVEFVSIVKYTYCSIENNLLLLDQFQISNSLAIIAALLLREREST